MVINNPGINTTIGDINIIEIVPMEIEGNNWLCVGFEESSQKRGDNIHLALILSSVTNNYDNDLVEALLKSLAGEENVLLRIHSECILGDALHSGLCDCGKQLSSTINLISNTGSGIILYLRQEGRGIGLRNKLSCLAIQEGYLRGKKIDKKYSPDQANLVLGHPIDNRNYEIASEFIKLTGLKSIRLISGNPEKINTLKNNGVEISEIVDIPRTDHTQRELKEIKEKLSRNYHYPNLKFS